MNWLQKLICPPCIDEDVENLKDELEIITKENLDLKYQVAQLEEPQWLIPDWIDTSKPIYDPKVLTVNKNGTVKKVAVKQTDFFNHSDLFKGFIQSIEGLSNSDKLIAIWKFVINNTNYEFDYEEDWRHAPITYRSGYGDCEDTSILFMVLARMARIPADQIFLCTGWFETGKEKFGHAWITAWYKDKYCIFETTLSKIAEPKESLTSPYYPEWGICNWRFQGKLKYGERI